MKLPHIRDGKIHGMSDAGAAGEMCIRDRSNAEHGVLKTIAALLKEREKEK